MNARDLMNRQQPATMLAAMKTLVPERKADRIFVGGVLVIKVVFDEVETFDTLVIGFPEDPLIKVAVATGKIESVLRRRETAEGKDDYLSSQNTNPDKGRYGGGIVLFPEANLIVGAAFCGGPAVLDESLSAAALNRTGLALPPDFKNEWFARTYLLLNGGS